MIWTNNNRQCKDIYDEEQMTDEQGLKETKADFDSLKKNPGMSNYKTPLHIMYPVDT